MPSVESPSLRARISEIRQALDNRRLDDGAKLRLFLSDKDIEAVAGVVSGGAEAAQSLMITTANKVVWASTASFVTRARSTQRRPPDHYLFAVVRACCDFWQKSEGRKLRYSNPSGSSGEACGPLIRFICLVHDILIGEQHIARPNTVAGHIRKIRDDNTGAFGMLR